MTMGNLAGKVAFVSGAGRGLGREIALRLASDGADIIAHFGESREGAEAVAAEAIRMGRRGIAVQANIAQHQEIVEMFGRIDDAFNRLDIVVNSAGVSGGGPLADLNPDDVEWMLGINLKGPLYVASEAAKRLPKGGRLINIGSSMSQFPMGGSGLYSATKSAIKSLTESWARELGKAGVTVNTVIPGATSPGMADNTPEPYRSMFEQASPFGRIGEAREVAAVVAFLASEEASWVSGAHIMCNGAASI